MSPDTETPSASPMGEYRYVLAGIGLAQGLLWWAISADSASTAKISVSAFALAAGLTGQFLWVGRDLVRWAALSGTFGAIVGALSFWVLEQRAETAMDHERLFRWILAAFVMLYVLVPFAQIAQRTGKWVFPYQKLFFHSWNNFFIGLVAFIFVYLFAMLVLLGTGLFGLLGFEFFSDLVGSDAFIYLTYPTLFGLGIAIGRESEGVLNTLKRIAFSLCHGFLPLLAGLALAFLIALLFSGLQPLWDTGYTTPLLLTVVGLAVLMINGVFQSGDEPPPYAPLVRHGVEALIVTTPIFVGIGAYSTGLRITQYGLSPDRVWAAVLLSIAALFSIGYVAAAFRRRGEWMALAKPVNVAAALAIAALVIATHTPILDPVGMSAASQARRLISGRVSADEFDFAFMQFRLGKPGRQWLERLAQLDKHPEAEKIREAIQLAQSQEHYYQAERSRGRHSIAEKIQAIPPLESIPDDLQAAITGDLDPVYARCPQGYCYFVYPIDLDGNGSLEYCLIDATGLDYSQRCYTRRQYDEWTPIGNYLFTEGTRPELTELLAAVEIRGVELEPPLPRRYSDLRIGEAAFRLSGGEGPPPTGD